MLSPRNLTRGEHVIDASFDLRRGEVLGISGLIGAGRTELLRLLAGVDRPSSGDVIMDGAAPGRQRARRDRGRDRPLARGAQARRHRAGPPDHKQRRPAVAGRFAPAGMVRKRALRDETQEMMQRLDLRPLAIDRPIRNFSGGNQQKAIIGRWIMAAPRSCSSTSRRAASTSAPRPRSTT